MGFSLVQEMFEGLHAILQAIGSTTTFGSITSDRCSGKHEGFSLVQPGIASCSEAMSSETALSITGSTLLLGMAEDRDILVINRLELTNDA